MTAPQALAAAKIPPVDPVRVVSEPRRREILRLIWDAERPASEIAAHFDVTFGAVSQHLGVLQEAGLVSVRRDGTRRFYRANRSALRPFASMLRSMWAAELDTLAVLAEEAERGGTQRSGGAKPGRRSRGQSRRSRGRSDR
jgi:DNA-binding transcriptional ArsR family regulator